MKRPKLGATGKYPQGKLNTDDEGELKLAVAFDAKNNVVVIDFGKPVTWFAMNPMEAVAFADLLIQKASQS